MGTPDHVVGELVICPVGRAQVPGRVSLIVPGVFCWVKMETQFPLFFNSEFLFS